MRKQQNESFFWYHIFLHSVAIAGDHETEPIKKDKKVNHLKKMVLAVLIDSYFVIDHHSS